MLPESLRKIAIGHLGPLQAPGSPSREEPERQAQGGCRGPRAGRLNPPRSVQVRGCGAVLDCLAGCSRHDHRGRRSRLLERPGRPLSGGPDRPWAGTASTASIPTVRSPTSRVCAGPRSGITTTSRAPTSFGMRRRARGGKITAGSPMGCRFGPWRRWRWPLRPRLIGAGVGSGRLSQPQSD